MNLPAVLIEGEYVAFVLDAGDGVGVPVARREHFVGRVRRLPAAVGVLGTIVPH